MAHLKTYQSHNVALSWWAAAAVMGLLLFCVAYLLWPSLSARYVFNQFETLQLGHSNFDDAVRLANKIGAHPVYGPCDRSACEWDVRIGNSKLPEWWRGLGETFLVAFDVKDSVVVRKNTGYGIGTETSTFFPSSVGLIEQEHWGRGGKKEPVAAGWQTAELYRYYEFIVYMTPMASAADRKRYTSFNFNCFWKYRGCKDARGIIGG